MNEISGTKGRGATGNPHNRFSSQISEPENDGWRLAPPEEPSLVTETIIDQSRSIISTNRSPDIPFDQSINPYKGCEHGCVYCYARPTHAYWDLSPGLDFESRIIVKPQAARLLKEQLSNPRYEVTPICIGANTDPYQPLESRLRTTREILEVLHEFQHPFSIITKSTLIERDLDLIAPMAADNLCSVAISVTTLDDDLKRKMEPRTPTGRARLNTLHNMASAGVPVTLLAAPMIPYINDQELETIMKAGREAGALSCRYILLRLPLEISTMFQDWLAEHFPDRANKVMSIMRQSRGGSDYQAAFGTRMRGTGVFADILHQRWQVASARLGFNHEARFDLDTTVFQRINKQLTLF